MLESMEIAILIASALIVVAVFTSLISFRFGAPLLLVFLVVGLLAGEDGIGGIHFDNSSAAFFIGSIALALILFDSGFETRIATLRVAALPAITLATAGVVLTAVLVALAAQLLFGVSWLHALLIGAIVGPTDAAAVFFLLRVGGINLRDRLRSTLEVESALNDPIAILLTLSLVGAMVSGAGTSGLLAGLAGDFVLQSLIGTAVGVAGGVGIVQIINRTNFEPALYPILVIALALAIWAISGMLGGSGFVAAYVAGLIAGNSRMRHTGSLRRFQQGTTWLSQIAMFLTLGLLATPSQFGKVAVPAVALALFLTFVARPVAVWICLMPFRFNRREMAFVSWVGLRGAVSILLGIVPIIGGLPDAQAIFNTAFIVVLVSLLLQGWTIRPIADYLDLVVPQRHSFVDRFELELPGRGDYEVVSYVIHPESPVAKGERIPRWARPSLFIRDGRSLRPHSAGRPQPGDQVYVITTPNYVGLLDRLFADPGQRADDPRLFGEFVIEPGIKLSDLAGAYGITIGPDDEALTVADVLRRDLAGDIEPGDRVAYGPVDLIVRKVSDAHAIEEVGLALEHEHRSRPNLPIFQSRREIAEMLRRWLRRLAAGTRKAAEVTVAKETAPEQPEPTLSSRPGRSEEPGPRAD
jgi:cell volume regulation protein A